MAVTKPVIVKQIRTKLGMSQSQFAEYFHINISTLQMWEQGINNTPPTTLYLLMRVLELEGRPFTPEDAPAEVESVANEA